MDLDRPVGEDWLDAAVRTAQAWNSETRGQTWGEVEFRAQSIVVGGIESDTDVGHLRNYLRDVADAVTSDIENSRLLTERLAAQAEATRQVRAEDDAKLTERFRGLPD